MKIYVDTSVIIAFFDEANHFHNDSKSIMEYPNLEFFSGNITLLELESVISRNISQFKLNFNIEKFKEYQNLTEPNKISFLAAYFLIVLIAWSSILQSLIAMSSLHLTIFCLKK